MNVIWRFNVKYKEFITKFYDATNYDFKYLAVVDKRRRINSDIGRNNRKNMIYMSYVSMGLFLVLSFLWFPLSLFFLLGVLFLFVICLYVERFSFIFYYISYLMYLKDITPSEKMLKEFCFSKEDIQHFYGDNQSSIVLRRVSNRSLFKMKYNAHKKGRYDSVLCIIKRTKVIIKNKNNSIVVAVDELDRKKFEVLLVEKINSLLD
jgi:hypothetical protein